METIDPLAQINEILAQVKKSAKEPESVLSREKEATLVLKSIRYLTSVVTRTCKNCKQDFQTDYYFKYYCSRNCLKKALEDIGLEWDPGKTDHERWHGEPPATIYPETLKILKKWAKKILEYEEPEPEPEPPPDDKYAELRRQLLEDQTKIPPVDKIDRGYFYTH